MRGRNSQKSKNRKILMTPVMAHLCTLKYSYSRYMVGITTQEVDLRKISKYNARLGGYCVFKVPDSSNGDPFVTFRIAIQFTD